MPELKEGQDPILPDYYDESGNEVDAEATATGTRLVAVVVVENPDEKKPFRGYVNFCQFPHAGNKVGEGESIAYYYKGGEDAVELGKFKIGQKGFALEVGSGLTLQVQTPIVLGESPVGVILKSGVKDGVPVISAPPKPAATNTGKRGLITTAGGRAPKPAMVSMDEGKGGSEPPETGRRVVGGKRGGKGGRTLADLESELGSGTEGD